MDDAYYNETVNKYEESTSFYPSDILDECPKFRILVVGQTGSGKSTLCSKVFRVDKDDGKVRGPVDFGISKHSRGTQYHQVWKEITFPGQNEDIILHDSGGFEAGDVEGLKEIRKFIEDRLKKTTLADRLHCIWYCIPLLGHRHIQSAEETFFRKFELGNIPVVAVFTHFDKIEEEREMTLMKDHWRRHGRGSLLPEDLPARAHAFAVQDYDEIYRSNLEKLLGPHSGVAIQRVSMPDEAQNAGGEGPQPDEGVQELIGATQKMLTGEGLRRLWVSAQQQSADLKRIESVSIAMAHFGKVTITNSVPLIPFLGGAVLQKSFDKIFGDVNKQYGLIDPYHVLRGSKARARIFGACLKLSTSGTIGIKVAMNLNILGPMTAPTITKALLKMITGVIMIHEELFWKQRDQGGLRLTEEVIKETCTRFIEGNQRRNAAAHIDGSIDISNYRSKQYCEDTVTTALKYNASEKKKTMV